MTRRIIGITGGYATGKTTVADMLAEKGAVKIDADEIGRRLLEEDGIKRRVVEAFGDDVLTGDRIDRRKLARKVFGDPGSLKTLCGITHPEIIRRIKDLIAGETDRIVVIDAPLLIESGLDDIVDVTVVVTAEYGTQIERAGDRGLSEEEAKRIIDSQMPLPEKVKVADYIIDNNGDVEITKEGVEKLWQEM